METQTPNTPRWPLAGAVLLALGCLATTLTSFADSIAIDISASPVKTLTRPLVGENASFLMSSDRHIVRNPARTTWIKDRLKQMGIGFSRFPYGTMGQNYRWHTPTWDASKGAYDYSSAINGLKPRVTTQALNPGPYTWAVNSDGTFSGTLDFDEYMEECHYAGTEPIIVINLTGDLNMALADPATAATNAPGPLTETQMATEAAEWVRYANKIRGYNVKYWEIGNEQDLSANSAFLSQANFVSRYDTFVQAMKAVDSTIKVGPGLSSSTAWLDALYNDTYAKQNLDFVVAHQYLYGAAWANDYGTWSANTGDVITTITNVDSWVTSHYTSTTGPELLVTECGPISFGGWQEEQGNRTSGIDFHLKSSGKYLEYESDGSALVQGAKPDDPIRRMVIHSDGNFPVYFRIKAASVGGSATAYLAAGATTSAPLAFTGTDQDDYSQWRMRGAGSTWYLESRHYPGYYLAIASSTATALTLTNTKGSGAVVSFDSTVLSSSETTTGSNLWSHPTTSMLRENATARMLSVSGSSVYANTQVGQNTDAFSFQLQNVDSNGTVKILAVNSQSTTLQYLAVAGNATNTTVVTTGSGSDATSQWKYHYVDVDPTSGVNSQFQLESVLYPGKYLMVDPSSFTVTANGSPTASAPGTCTFKLVTLPGAIATTYPTKPAYDGSAPVQLLNGDFYKSLAYSEMLLESLTIPHVGAMVHWNTQYNGPYGTWGNTSDSITPTATLDLTPDGIVQQLLNTYVSSNVVYATPVGTASPLRTYACYDHVTGQLAVVVLNKSQQPQPLTLSFTGTSPFTPAAYVDLHTYATSVTDASGLPDPEDLYPAVTDLTNQALPAGNQFTIPALCLQVIVLSDPTHAGGPVDNSDPTKQAGIRFTLNSVAKPAVWVNTTSAAKVGVAAPATFNTTPFLDLTNFFTLTQPGGANSYQISPISTTAGTSSFFTYSTTNRTAQVTVGGAAGSANSEWTWTPKAGATATYLQLFTNLVPTASMRANLTTGTGEMPVDTNGTVNNWAQYWWNYAPLAPVGHWVMIRSVANGNVLSAPLSGTMAAVYSPTPAGPDAAGNLSHEFLVTYVGNGLVKLRSQLSTTNYLKAGATTTAAVTIAGLGNESDQSSYWRPLFSTTDDRMYLQSASTGGFLTVESDNSVDTSATSPAASNTCYWVYAQ